MTALRASLGRIAAMASKEVRHILRDRQMLGFALAMPVALLLLFGYAVSFDVEDIPLVVVDQDHTAQSRALAERFTAAGTFQEILRVDDPAEVEGLFRRGAARVALMVPKGFSRVGAAGNGQTAQLLLDGSDNTSTAVALGYADAVALQASQAALAAAAPGFEPPLSLRTRLFFNPGAESTVVLVPGLMAVILVMIAVMLTALTVAREYERGSMEQLFATPVGRLEIILGKLGPYFLLGQMQVLLVLVVGVGLFNVPVAGNLAILFTVASLFLLAMLAQGLVLSVVTRSQMVSSQLAALTTLLPAILLSGFIFPIANMPPPLRAVASVLPARYLVHALRAVLLRGNGWASVWPDALATGLFFAVMLLIATRRFRRVLA